MDRLDAMTTVLEVARAGSLSAAGRSLRMPLASVSRRVSELEAYLGAQLFTRTGRKLTLTAAGDAYVLACQRIIDDVNEAERAVSGEYHAPKGSLTLTAPVAFGRMHLLPVVIAFLKAYPQIDVRILFTETTLSLIEEQIDIALRIGPLTDSQLHARPVGEVRRVVCVSPDYLEAQGRLRVPEDLADRDCVTLQSIASVRTWVFRNGRREITQSIHTRLGTNATQAAIDAAVAGIGPTQVLSYQIAEEVGDRRLRIVLADYEPEPWPVHLVYVKQGPLPQKVKAFLDWATPRLKDSLKAVA